MNMTFNSLFMLSNVDARQFRGDTTCKIAQNFLTYKLDYVIMQMRISNDLFRIHLLLLKLLVV